MILKRKFNNLLFPRRNRVLFIEDRIPYRFLGSGFPRSNEMLHAMAKIGLDVTLYPLWPDDDLEVDDREEIDSSIKLLNNKKKHYKWELESFIEEQGETFGNILVSRPHNMEMITPILKKFSKRLSSTRILYDAEAVSALREIEYRRLIGKVMPKLKQEKLVASEIDLVEMADYVLTVSKNEGQIFEKYGFAPEKVVVLSHTMRATPSINNFDKRKDILFVGAIHDESTPNADGMKWFKEKVLPELNNLGGKEMSIISVGINKTPKTLKTENEQIIIKGKVDELAPVYNSSRIFIAPIRFGAGIPLKVIEAAAIGIPVVATKFVADQIGWKDGVEILASNNPEEFAKKCLRLYTDDKLWRQIRENALERVSNDFSEAVFTDALRKVFPL